MTILCEGSTARFRGTGSFEEWENVGAKSVFGGNEVEVEVEELDSLESGG